MRITVAAMTGLIVLSGINGAQAQQMRGLHKHDAPIAAYNYSIPIQAGESPAGGSLKDDIDSGNADLGSNAPAMASPVARTQAYVPAPRVDTSRYINQPAPNFTLPSVQGGMVGLANLIAKGPAIVLFVRGASSAQSVQQLHLLQKNLPQFAALGIQVAAITSEPAASASAAQQHYNFGFPLLVDANKATSGQYGILQANEPVPSMFSIDQQGKIIAVQIQSAQGPGFNLTEAAASFRGGATQPAIQAPTMPNTQMPSNDAMLKQVPGNAPVMQGNVNAAPQMLGHMGDDSAPVMPNVPSPNMPSPVMPQPMLFEVPPSSPDFLKQIKNDGSIAI